MVNILEKSQDIIKVLFFVNLIFLILSFFSNPSMGLLITINIILLGSFMVIKKYSWVFDGMIATNKLFKGLDKGLGAMYKK